MKPYLLATTAFLVLLSLNCTGFRQIERKDTLGRISGVYYYDGSSLERFEEITYYGNSHNPSRIVYKSVDGLDSYPYKEENYQFTSNNIARISFSIYRGETRIDTGYISFHYEQDLPVRIEYYARAGGDDELFIFGLDHYRYQAGTIEQRRVIEYDINPETGRPMQTGHYVITFDEGSPRAMRLSILDKKSKKIIEKNVDDALLVKEKIDDIERYFNRRSRGKEFINSRSR